MEKVTEDVFCETGPARRLDVLDMISTSCGEAREEA